MEWINQNIGVFIGIVLALINICGWIWSNFNKAYKFRRTVDGYLETVENHTKQISEMNTRHKGDYLNLNCKIDNITNTLTSFIQETKKDNQVALRDKIDKAYKETLQKGYILEKDSKNYHYALERYKANDGNSYVLDEIEPRMKDFKVFVSDRDAEEYFQKR